MDTTHIKQNETYKQEQSTSSIGMTISEAPTAISNIPKWDQSTSPARSSETPTTSNELLMNFQLQLNHSDRVIKVDIYLS